MVRLTDIIAIAYHRTCIFQFLYGAINGDRKFSGFAFRDWFQFLYGAINGKIQDKINPLICQFQFLYGAINGVFEEATIFFSNRFQFLYGAINGIERSHFQDCALVISIPLWCD